VKNVLGLLNMHYTVMQPDNHEFAEGFESWMDEPSFVNNHIDFLALMEVVLVVDSY
jgi:hypothetical protein